MADLQRKTETIRTIENLQLSSSLISALDDNTLAESIAEAINCLQVLSQQWN